MAEASGARGRSKPHLADEGRRPPYPPRVLNSDATATTTTTTTTAGPATGSTPDEAAPPLRCRPRPRRKAHRRPDRGHTRQGQRAPKRPPQRARATGRTNERRRDTSTPTETAHLRGRPEGAHRSDTPSSPRALRRCCHRMAPRRRQHKHRHQHLDRRKTHARRRRRATPRQSVWSHSWRQSPRAKRRPTDASRSLQTMQSRRGNLVADGHAGHAVAGRPPGTRWQAACLGDAPGGERGEDRSAGGPTGGPRPTGSPARDAGAVGRGLQAPRRLGEATLTHRHRHRAGP